MLHFCYKIATDPKNRTKMATVKMILQKDRTTDGKYPIYMRVSDRFKRAYRPTGFYATEAEVTLDDNGSVKYKQGRGVPQFTVVRVEAGQRVDYTNKSANDKLEEMIGKVRKLIDGYTEKEIDWTPDMLMDDFQKKPGRMTFIEYANKVIEEEYVAKGRFRRAGITKDMLRSLERYDAQLSKRYIQDINKKYIDGYVTYFTNLGNKENTIGIRLREIRCILNLAIKEGVGSESSYPFSKDAKDDGTRISHIKNKTRKRYLPVENLKAMATGKLSQPYLEVYRHLFLFSLYSRGINWKDMALLTTDSFYPDTIRDDESGEDLEVTMMKYKRSKTKGEFDIWVTDEIQGELDWFKKNTVLYKNYVLPIILKDTTPEHLDDYLKARGRRYNLALKEIAKELGFPASRLDVSAYWSRHSFAMTMLSNKESVDVISHALGHQSIETTKTYLESYGPAFMAKHTKIDLTSKPEQNDPQHDD